ncbi:MAG: hypothetical protein GPOALKHO_000594 [Sodalis sp.]|nr:MAG: hypothetical protein GPOALKHO_000594 [Sodalis sp.]
MFAVVLLQMFSCSRPKIRSLFSACASMAMDTPGRLDPLYSR